MMRNDGYWEQSRDSGPPRGYPPPQSNQHFNPYMFGMSMPGHMQMPMISESNMMAMHQSMSGAMPYMMSMMPPQSQMVSQMPASMPHQMPQLPPSVQTNQGALTPQEKKRFANTSIASISVSQFLLLFSSKILPRLRNRINQAKLRVREKEQITRDREELNFLRNTVTELTATLDELKAKLAKYEGTPEPEAEPPLKLRKLAYSIVSGNSPSAEDKEDVSAKLKDSLSAAESHEGSIESQEEDGDEYTDLDVSDLTERTNK